MPSRHWITWFHSFLCICGNVLTKLVKWAKTASHHEILGRMTSVKVVRKFSSTQKSNSTAKYRWNWTITAFYFQPKNTHCLKTLQNTVCCLWEHCLPWQVFFLHELIACKLQAPWVCEGVRCNEEQLQQPLIVTSVAFGWRSVSGW